VVRVYSRLFLGDVYCSIWILGLCTVIGIGVSVVSKKSTNSDPKELAVLDIASVEIIAFVSV
jgi:hypothetical protein